MRVLDTRYQVSLFSRFDYKSVEDHLAVMVAKGWAIKHAGAILWKFKRVKPSNKKFCVILSNDSEHNLIFAQNQKLLEELSNNDGWEQVIQWKQTHIFCADEKAAASLKIDEVARIASASVAMKKVFILPWATALGILLILAFSNGLKYFGNSIYRDEGTIWAFLIALYGVVVAGFALLVYAFWLTISRKNISKGGRSINTAWPDRLMNVLLLGFLAIVIGYFVDKIYFPIW